MGMIIQHGGNDTEALFIGTNIMVMMKSIQMKIITE